MENLQISEGTGRWTAKFQFPRHEKALAYALEQIQASPLAPYVTDVILFGSIARGNARFDSDVDLLMLVSDEACERKDFARECRTLTVDVQTSDYRDAELDLHIKKSSLFFASTQVFDWAVRKEGISVWKAN
jgi:predicted nucleotidyltransferase